MSTDSATVVYIIKSLNCSECHSFFHFKFSYWSTSYVSLQVSLQPLTNFILKINTTLCTLESQQSDSTKHVIKNFYDDNHINLWKSTEEQLGPPTIGVHLGGNFYSQ